MAARYFIPLFFALALPLLVFAQNATTEDAALREAIRADIMADPRSSEMSASEIDTMVESLAAQSEDQGTAQQYLEMRESFTEPVPPVYEEEAAGSEWNAMSIAILTLLLVLAGVVAFLVWHRKHHHSKLFDGTAA